MGSNPTRSAKNETPQTGCFRFWRNERVGFGPTCPRGKGEKRCPSGAFAVGESDSSLLARNEHRARIKRERRRLSERYRIRLFVRSAKKSEPFYGLGFLFASKETENRSLSPLIISFILRISLAVKPDPVNQTDNRHNQINAAFGQIHRVEMGCLQSYDKHGFWKRAPRIVPGARSGISCLIFLNPINQMDHEATHPCK